jgi:hypothetical protein
LVGNRLSLTGIGRAKRSPEIHSRKKVGNATVQKHFLRKCHALLPTGCRPIIVTDAGFKNTWFKVAKIYALRTQIEEPFRDTKNHRFGWSFEDGIPQGLTPIGRS